MAELDGPRRRAIVYACHLADEVAIGGGGHAGFATVPEIEDGVDGRTDLQNERVLDLLQGAAEGDDLSQ